LDACVYNTQTHAKMSSEQSVAQIEKTISKLVSDCCHAKLWKEKCNCEEIKTIQKHIRIWIKNINKLEPILFNNNKIHLRDIDVFKKKYKAENDSNNKQRENIIVCILNNKIPEQYYNLSLRWRNLKLELDTYIQKLCKEQGIDCLDNIHCIPKAGRGHHYDFNIIINDSYEFMTEFKFNASCVNETPQFVSLSKPSQYLNKNFENWFYKNALTKIANWYDLELPSQEEYCATIHNNIVECMKPYKEKYDNDITFRNFCKKIDKEGIKAFIQVSDIVKEFLTEKLLNSQKNKHYMCYDDGKIYYDKLNENIYKLTKLIYKDNTNYIYETESGMNLEIKLRFKNGCGIQFPALQIQRKIPNVNELKKLCAINNIKAPRLKKDICNILTENNVMY